MQITRGIIPKAKKVCIYGPEGIGKSTLASRFPDPVFIDTEGSTAHMDVARLPVPSSWQMLKDAVAYVKQDPSCCRTLVIDTADWAEKLCIDEICAKKRISGIEDIGYGKGYVYVKEEFGKLLNLLTDVTEAGVNVVITAHAMMRKFEQPDELGAYDRWELKLSKQCAPLVKEWADMVLFCNYKTLVVNVDGQGAQKGKNKVQGGRRVMYTTHHSCWDAKNRFGLPDELPMDFSAIMHLFVKDAGTAAPSTAAAAPSTAPSTAPAPVIPPEETFHEPTPGETAEIPFKGEPAAPMGGTAVQQEMNLTSPPPDERPASEMKSVEAPVPPPGVVSRYMSDPARIPKSLKDLMERDDVTEMELQDAVFSKGYYPQETKIQDMDPAFIDGWAVAYWPQVLGLIKDIRKNGIKFD